MIIMLKFLVPELFNGLQNTLLVFFSTVQTVLGAAVHPGSMTAGFIPY